MNEQKAGAQVSPDVFLSVSRSLVAAADARYDEMRRLDALARSSRAPLAAAKTEAERAAIGEECANGDESDPGRDCRAARRRV